jgi:hypothetical protein
MRIAECEKRDGETGMKRSKKKETVTRPFKDWGHYVGDTVLGRMSDLWKIYGVIKNDER